MKKTEKHVKNITDTILASGFVLDRFGNYKTDNGIYRFNFGKSAIRYEKKTGKHWTNLNSDYFKNIVVKNNSVFIKGISVCVGIVKKPEKTTKTDTKPVSVKDLTKGIQVSNAKPIDTGKDKDKDKKKGKFTRDKAVVQAIKSLKTFTFPALLNKSDKIMVSKGFTSNPTATNVNKYGLVALIAFGVVTQDKPGCIGMKNSIKYTLVS